MTPKEKAIELVEIIEISKKMDDLNGVMVNCLGTPQADFIHDIWKDLRKTLLDKIEQVKTNAI